ncbi:MAG: RagB/SusD family nutrient uptake outer membrane protein [Dysgonamonadaceae bacterium]|jgi:hypothetical protein|nr:RagB/SusD family nutrient uptake outer membrane protein [Dysgonamonadaceae bacterium]
MKEKNIKTIIVSLLTATMLLPYGCSDVLDQAPDGKISLDEVFADNDKTAAYLNTCYLYIPGEGCSTYFVSRAPSIWTDDAWDVDAEAEPWIASGRMYNGEASASNHPILYTGYMNGSYTVNANNGNYWNLCWQGIRKCTVFLTRIDAAPVTSEENRSRWRAEAHLLRAYYYHILLKWFGTGMPLEETAYSLDFDYSTLVKSSYKETVDFMIKDCDIALASASLPWRITSSAEAFRFTKGMAELLKSRMILMAASPLYNEGNDYWTEAYNTTKTAMNNLRANGYELYNKVNYTQVFKSENAYFYPDGKFPNDYAALYNEYFVSDQEWAASPVDKETIYSTNAVQDRAYHIDGIGAQFQYKTGTCPSQELVDCYEMTNGEPILDIENPYTDAVTHLQPNINPKSGYNEQNPYVNRDPRFYASIYYNGSKRNCYWPFDETNGSAENFPASKGVRTRVIATWDGEPQTGISPTARIKTRTGYYLRKFMHPLAGDDGAYTEIILARPKVMRFAEAILNFAEAALEAGHPDEARTAVNEIRARVGMPELPASLTTEQLRLRIRNERRVEFAMEGHRYFDVRRWHKPDENLETTDRWITAMWITRNSDASYTYRRGPVSKERLCYTNKFLWVPLPMNEVNKLFSLTGENWQNPGW